MPIRLTCHFCGKKFSAWDDLVGTSVQCPQCGQKMVVPVDPLAGGPPSKGTTRRKTSAPAKTPDEDERRSLVDRPKPKAMKLTSKTPAKSQPTDPTTSSAAPTLPPIPGTQPKKPPTKPDPPCPHCGEPFPEWDDMCDECGYHRVLKKVIDFDGVKRPGQGAGLDRAMHGQLDDTADVHTVLLWLKLLIGFCVIVAATTCLGALGLLFSFVIVAGLLFVDWIMGLRRAETGSGEDPTVGLLWTLLLHVERAINWRVLRWPFPRTRVLVFHTNTFTDEDLAELELSDFDTLDLEGTAITDESVQYLKPLRRLRFLVVRKTKLTPTGIRQLHKYLPDTWIWT